MAGAEHQQADQGFSKLKPEPESEIFTKFADVKSRISWTAERRQLLREMWDRGDKTAVYCRRLGVQGRCRQRRARTLRPDASPHRVWASEGAG